MMARPKDGWKMRRDSLYKVIMYFRISGKSRTFYSMDWKSRFSKVRDGKIGLDGLRKRVIEPNLDDTKTVLIYDLTTDQLIEKYIDGIQVNLT